MPLGYEKIRDALIRKGMEEADAQTTAAKIWNKHHKGDEAVGPHYDKEKKMTTLSMKMCRDMQDSEGGGVLLGVPKQERRVELASIPSLGRLPVPRIGFPGASAGQDLLKKTGKTFLYDTNLKEAASKLGGDIEHVAEGSEHHVFKVGDNHFQVPKTASESDLADLYKKAGGRGRGMPFLGGLEDRRARVELGVDFEKAMGTLRSRLAKQGAEGLKKREARLTKKLGIDKFTKDSQYRTALSDPVPSHPANPRY